MYRWTILINKTALYQVTETLCKGNVHFAQYTHIYKLIYFIILLSNDAYDQITNQFTKKKKAVRFLGEIK